MTVFDLEHIFIVFAPGAGGNFISGLLDNLVTNQLSRFTISTTGSAHISMAKKAAKQDYISFGTFKSERENFESDAKRLEYYISNIQDIDTPQVTWTHDYDNIKNYSDLFPNAKILVITADSEEEKLAVTFMFCVKNMLDEQVATPHPEKREHIWKRRNRLLNTELANLIPKNKIHEARLDNDIIKYLHIDRTMKLFRIMNYCDLPAVVHNNSMNLLNIDPYDTDQYLNDRCTVLPYKYLMTNDVELFLDAMGKLLPLNDEQRSYVVEMFDYYRNKQNLQMLERPYEFLEQLKMTFDEKIKAFNT